MQFITNNILNSLPNLGIQNLKPNEISCSISRIKS